MHLSSAARELESALICRRGGGQGGRSDDWSPLIKLRYNLLTNKGEEKMGVQNIVVMVQGKWDQELQSMCNAGLTLKLKI